MAYYEFFIKIPDTFKDTLIRRLTEAGCLGVIENDEALVAYFPGAIDIGAVTTDLSLLNAILEKTGGAHALAFDYTLIPEKDWNEAWKKDFQAVDAGERFTILPPWEGKRADRINLVIDPAMAFGTGHHETTRSCLVLMEKYGKKRQGSFLDLGTGTGILAIAASKLGFSRVVGIDTDPLAVDAALENIRINQVPRVEIREGSLTETTEDTYDVIAANLISGVLVQLARALSVHLNPGGIAILSGILVGQEHEVIEAMEQAGMKLTEKYRDGKWISLVVEQPDQDRAKQKGRLSRSTRRTQS